MECTGATKHNSPLATIIGLILLLSLGHAYGQTTQYGSWFANPFPDPMTGKSSVDLFAYFDDPFSTDYQWGLWIKCGTAEDVSSVGISTKEELGPAPHPTFEYRVDEGSIVMTGESWAPSHVLTMAASDVPAFIAAMEGGSKLAVRVTKPDGRVYTHTAAISGLPSALKNSGCHLP